MRSIKRSCWLLAVLGGVLGAVGWRTFGSGETISKPNATGATSLKAAQEGLSKECVGCDQDGMVRISTGGSPRENAELLREGRLRAQMRTRETQHAAYLEKAKELQRWRGTRAFLAQGFPDELKAPAAVAQEYFLDDPPAPVEREKIFAEFFSGDSPYECKGWDVIVAGATPNEVGHELEVQVRPWLVHEAGVFYTPQLSIETWQLKDADGSLVFVDAVDNGKRGVSR